MKVTDASTIIAYMKFLESQAKQMNLQYCNITLDVGAAMNAFLVKWQREEEFKNIIIHLGDFHFLKENFKVLGMLIRNSGFQDIVFCSRICTSGSLNGVLAGSHYNRAWRVHSAFSEGLERCLYKRFRFESKNSKLPEPIESLLGENDHDFITDERISNLKEMSDGYEKFKQKCRNGDHDENPKFWVAYIDFVQMQQRAQTAIQEGDFDARLEAWIWFLPYYFSFSMQNYARYASFYVELINCIDQLHPGMRDEFLVGIQAQDRYPHMTPIDQRGEQTFNREAKVAGGMQYAHTESQTLKWSLNRRAASDNVVNLKQMAGLHKSNDPYYQTTPSQIVKSEDNTSSVYNEIRNTFINPFMVGMDTELMNLSSGIAVNRDAASSILSIRAEGIKLYNNFRDERLLMTQTKFHAPIKKHKRFDFNHDPSTTKKKTSAKCTSASLNRNILGTLHAWSLKTNEKIDYEEALKYPLAIYPLSLSHPDGQVRKITKSDMKSILLKNVEIMPTITSTGAAVIDLVPVLHQVPQVSGKLENTMWKIISIIKENYLLAAFQRVDIVADNYQDAYVIKRGEQSARGTSERITMKTRDMSAPANFMQRMLHNNDNKYQFIQLFFKFIEDKISKILQTLRCEELVLSGEEMCTKFTSSSATTYDAL